MMMLLPDLTALMEPGILFAVGVPNAATVGIGHPAVAHLHAAHVDRLHVAVFVRQQQRRREERPTQVRAAALTRLDAGG